MWAQLLNTALGIWLMIAPALLGFDKTVANNSHITGPIIATIAITAIFESTRVVRTFNIPFGLWLLVAPWVLGYEHATAIVNDMVTGALVIGFSLVKGKIQYRFAGGWASLWQQDTLHEKEAKKRQA